MNRAHVLICFCTISFTIADGPKTSGTKPSFQKDIRPILSDNCYACHGPAAQESDLRLDQRESALRVLFGKGQDPQEPATFDVKLSPIMQRISSTDADVVMPPPKSHKKLSDEQKAMLADWLRAGAPYERHWAFEPIRSGDSKTNTPSQVIDQYLNKTLGQSQLKVAGKADRPTLIRRVAFTLTGLPPTIAEVDQFVNDPSPNAYEKMVDRYLSSSRFGEEMARDWLDVARYGDTHGLHLDNERQMWMYRNWVIHAFNRNLPFDRFVKEQLAGDILAEQERLNVGGSDRDRISNPLEHPLIATGFLRCNVSTSEGGSIDEEWIFRNAVDRTSTVINAFMGITGGCAVCHDHKFDPLTAKEYYQMYAFFHSAADPAMDGNALLTTPVRRVDWGEHVQRLEQNTKELQKLRSEMMKHASTLSYQDPADSPGQGKKETTELWFDDAFPAGSQTQGPPQIVDAKKGKVQSGSKSLRGQSGGLTQEVCQPMPAKELPENAELFAYVWLDPKNPPKSVMLQYHTDGWKHRAVWGDYDAIGFGAKNTTERVHMGPLPALGQWVKIAVDAKKIGLTSGSKIVGFAVTQFAGTVYWDSVGFSANVDPARDPRHSQQVWWQTQASNESTAGLPADLAQLLAAGAKQKLNDDQAKQVRAYYLAFACQATKAAMSSFNAKLTQLSDARKKLEEEIPGTFVYRDLPNPRDSFVMLRGQYDKKGEKVQPNTPKWLPPLQSKKPRPDRLDLANWLTSAEHPLTSRVSVNRFWQQIFGIGLVKSSGDFGMQGEAPSHPELLDWLSRWFIDQQWNVKALLKAMVMTDAFQRSASAGHADWQFDPENRLLARGPRIRLTAEQIRDNSLYLGGLLNVEQIGRGANTYQPPNIWEPVGFAGSNTRFYKQDSGRLLHTRSVYVFIKRTAPAPFLSNFDAPSREAFCTRRERSNTPLQALQLLNDVQHVESARAFAERIIKHAPDVKSRVEFAFRSTLARSPDAEEFASLSTLVDQFAQRFASDPQSASKMIAVGETKPDPSIKPAELATFTMLANVILNLDETITRP